MWCRPAIVVLLACCAPPHATAPICIADAMTTTTTATTDTAPPARSSRPPTDTATEPTGAIVYVAQRAGYIDVTYDAPPGAVLHVGAWTGPAAGYGVVVVPLRWTDLAVLEQDVRIRLVTASGVELATRIHDTHADVRRPGDWRYVTDGDGTTTVDCQTAGTVYGLSARYPGPMEVVWPHDADPAWIRVESDPGGAPWRLHPDRLVVDNAGDVFTAITMKPAAPVPTCIVRWIRP